MPDDFVIGAEDVLGVVFWREADISGDVTVRPDGRITLPVIGEMQAAGLRPAELQRQIVAASAKYLTEPNVAVVVRAINSRRVFITGRVTTPGGHPLKGPLNVMQAIALAGGLTEYADAKNIAVLRAIKGGTSALQVQLQGRRQGQEPRAEHSAAARRYGRRSLGISDVVTTPRSGLARAVRAS